MLLLFLVAMMLLMVLALLLLLLVHPWATTCVSSSISVACPSLSEDVFPLPLNSTKYGLYTRKYLIIFQHLDLNVLGTQQQPNGYH